MSQRDIYAYICQWLQSNEKFTGYAGFLNRKFVYLKMIYIYLK